MMFVWIFFFFAEWLPCLLHAQVEFVIVTPSYNNELYCINQLESITSQSYPSWSMIYINDCSTDRTGLIVEDFVFKRRLSDKIKVIHNRSRRGAMANIYHAVHMVEPEKVIICVDGDDKLSDPSVLEKIAKVYQDPNVWITYGNYRSEPAYFPTVCQPFPLDVITRKAFRTYQWVASHPKTFYAGLFHKVRKQDMQIGGKFVKVASDVAFMIPMLEMAVKGHFRFIPEILYIYNYQNPINDNRIKYEKVMKTEKKLRKKSAIIQSNRSKRLRSIKKTAAIQAVQQKRSSSGFKNIV